MDVPHDETKVVATAAASRDGEVDDANAAEDQDECSNYSSEGRLEKGYETDQGLNQVADESGHERRGTSDVRLRGLFDNLAKYISKANYSTGIIPTKSIQDHRQATRDEAAPTPAPALAPSAHHYGDLQAAVYASLCRDGIYNGQSSGYGSRGYGTRSGYGYGSRGYGGGLSDYDYGGGRGGYYRGISGYDYDGLGYYYYYCTGISNTKYGYGSGGGYDIGSGYPLGGGGGYDGISDYGYHYSCEDGYYSDFDYRGLGDRYSSSSDNSSSYRPEEYGHRYRGDGYLDSWYWPECEFGIGM
ncbi:hypothetical protein ZWY2020_012864 [Hordeum vulgare]|nr:hypothetical protein ZWY2020_012864 [Hordeum vulgare]